MPTSSKGSFQRKYPVCGSIFSDGLLKTIVSESTDLNLLSAMDELEKTCDKVCGSEAGMSPPPDDFLVNPTLELISIPRALAALLPPKNMPVCEDPGGSDVWVMVWKQVNTGKTFIRKVSPEDLLAFKITEEKINARAVSYEGNVSIRYIRDVLSDAARKGIVLAPASRLERRKGKDKYQTADIFTLQWHVTHACDLSCKHCYDRAKRAHPSIEKAASILDDLERFCADMFARGHVCFSGGNPFLYPHFSEVYRIAAEKGFSTSVLGNPVSREKVKELVKTQMPEYFQVSLEGLEDHNDFIRGKGSFRRAIEFLGVLKEEKVSSAVMLTLTKNNIDQVLPLAELLSGHADYFTFNRLSPVGEGARLEMPDRESYEDFLSEYIEASRSNPIMGFKDNLINAVLCGNNEELFGGCTGYGCGAAFNFLTLLPDGEMHACRKFPSYLGDINDKGIADIYGSDMAKKYREGTKGCDSCRIRHVCGGCLAAINGSGGDIFEEKDPYCFYAA